jgi:hypothetical protein
MDLVNTINISAPVFYCVYYASIGCTMQLLAVYMQLLSVLCIYSMYYVFVVFT